jgi:hypothetical protein
VDHKNGQGFSVGGDSSKKGSGSETKSGGIEFMLSNKILKDYSTGNAVGF